MTEKEIRDIELKLRAIKEKMGEEYIKIINFLKVKEEED